MKDHALIRAFVTAAKATEDAKVTGNATATGDATVTGDEEGRAGVAG
ncbi:hypothetical protein AB6O49_28005 [Streptomyces sp. SBR177]